MSDRSADLARSIEELKRLVETSDVVAGFTGAGISTESGVPDFRTPGSPWLQNKPIDYAAFMESEDARREAWRRKFAMDDIYRGARPSRGHRALADLVRRGKMPAIITQNIDGLQQAAGVPADKVIELHGNGTYAECLSCGIRHDLGSVRDQMARSEAAPTCLCGGIVKSATVSFGQPMPAEAMRRARALSESCDLFLAIGSSLVVYPAAGYPIRAKQAGATLVIVNREPTDLDGIADLVIAGDIGTVLAGLAEPAGG